MEKKYFKFKMKWLPLLAACTLLCMGITVSAQITPVGNEFLGTWSFDHAQAQERPMNTQGGYTSRAISLQELQSEQYFEDAPTQITFMEDKAVRVVSAKRVREVATAEIDHRNHCLNIRELIEIVIEREEGEVGEEGEEDQVESFYGLIPYTNFQISNSQMSLQYHYFYETGVEKYVEGVLTIYYKR